ncbi:MAG: AbrB/MazE/SpoVT family DNA-binding domain-containing protein [Candidatus Nitrosotalea sp.]|nr:AbrB/MazE/SpoVT family DNA-binding domain-containing protein [Candidatus Nitrosotalea sp.]
MDGQVSGMRKPVTILSVCDTVPIPIISLNPTGLSFVLEIILQKQRSRVNNGNNYYKYRITIPVQIVEQLRLKKGERLDVSVIQNVIVIRKNI